MSTVRLASIAMVGLALSTLGAVQAPAPAKAPADRLISALMQENQSLQKQNDALRAEIKSLQTRLADYGFYQQGSTPKTLPPGWKQGTFDGLPLYLVPCDTTSMPALSAPAK